MAARFPQPPKNLDEDGRILWRAIVRTGPLRPDQLEMLRHACATIDLIERLEDEQRGAPLTVKGSQGQIVSSPLVTEIRQHRSLLGQLLGRLRLQSEDTSLTEAKSSREAAISLARARWSKTG